MKTLKNFSVLGFLALAGCVGPTGYQPVGFKGGYADKMLSADTAAVGFEGNGFTDITRVRAMVLLRCAEVTLEHGYRYFVITGVYDIGRLSSFTTHGTATTNTYGNISGLGYGSNSATLIAQSDTTITPPQTVTQYKPGLVDWIKMSNSEKALEPYKQTKDDTIGDAALLVPRIRQSLGIGS